MRQLQEDDIVLLEMTNYKECCLAELTLRDKDNNPVTWPGRNQTRIELRVGMPQDGINLLELIADLSGFRFERKEMKNKYEGVFVFHKIDVH